ncbi:hypothetical protein GCM10022225_77890 [Plantactinospora mayteni]|uniref:Uncharacterized protein n=1 Tax=Plantactinospora mayteni TaxID=566021 RepID=A0ABQ4ERJ2_9ACTN|nr:hypothetical protein Pma05_38030 [Plantactinospora mayteni]
MLATDSRDRQGTDDAGAQGVPGALWTQAGLPRVAFAFTTFADKIAEINLIANSDHLHMLDLVMLDD